MPMSAYTSIYKTLALAQPTGKKGTKFELAKKLIDHINGHSDHKKCVEKFLQLQISDKTNCNQHRQEQNHAQDSPACTPSKQTGKTKHAETE